MKSAVRLYPVDIALIPHDPLPIGGGIRQQVFTSDPESGAVTRFVHIPAGAVWPEEEARHWTERWLFTGALRLADRPLQKGSYLSVAPGNALPALHALQDTVVMEFLETPVEAAAKESVVLDTDEIARMPWVRPDGSPDGIRHKILAAGDHGSLTRVLDVLPFVATGVFVHDHGEEVYLLEGSYKMGDEFHATGTYTCKGPGVEHGPFLSSEGYVGLEVRDYL